MKDWAAGRRQLRRKGRSVEGATQTGAAQPSRRGGGGYASDAFDVAVAAVDDAYEAAIEAIIARGDADEVSPVKLSA
jgi:hypothetical protein